MVDPHTAVGLAAARLYPPSSSVQVALSTAHPAKFSEAVAQALHSFSSFDFERDVLPEEFKGLLEKEKRVIEIPAAEVNLVKRVIEDHVDVGTSTASV